MRPYIRCARSRVARFVPASPVAAALLAGACVSVDPEIQVTTVITIDDDDDDDDDNDTESMDATGEDPKGSTGGGSTGEGSTSGDGSTGTTTGEMDGSESGTTVDAPVCGDGSVEGDEVCDDGNIDDGDLCSADCQMITPPDTCGDGQVQLPELCDDGNMKDGDGCEANCTPTPAPPVCGNGVVEAGEGCDDGNTIEGGVNDACNNDCTVYAPPACEAPLAYAVCDAGLNLADKSDKSLAHRAIGVCDLGEQNSIQISSYQLGALDSASWQIAKGFGSYKYDDDDDPFTPDELLYSPREGESMLLLSTGRISAPNNQGVVLEPNASQVGNGWNDNPNEPNSPPAPLSSAKGSNQGAGGTPFAACDGVHDCSDSLYEQWNGVGTGDPNDQMIVRLGLTVPPGVHGYRFDFVFCTSEWPSWVDTQFNDLFVAWQTDPSADDPNQAPGDPYTGNITVIENEGNPGTVRTLTATSLDQYLDGPGFSLNEPQLAGTGFQQNACTDWLTARGGVRPGAQLQLAFFLADMGDESLATMVILDNLRWECDGCAPGEIGSCGVQGL